MIATQAATRARCPVCLTAGDNLKSGSTLDSANGYAQHLCPSCGLVYSDPMRHPGAEWYAQSPLYMHRRSYRLPMWVIRRDWRYRNFLRLKPGRRGRLLDVGCGTGSFLLLARASGYQVSGVDSDCEAIEFARREFGLSDTRAMPVEQLISEPPAERYDVICLFDVLEHLGDPLEVIRGLGNLLAPGGSLVITVPSARRWPALFDPYVDAPPHHLTLWTPEALSACISNAGLKLDRVRASKLLGDDLLLHALWRFPVINRLGPLGTAVTGFGYLFVAPVVARLLSLAPRSRGFHLMGVGSLK